ncbi:hypothetical protein [Candidatus Poriferisodalis sp.]|uniref:hypothetical protein n=1 Tax=Candidatus Poriferisodalis sp. TaxID=3101277 RepID=UPI003B010A9A
MPVEHFGIEVELIEHPTEHGVRGGRGRADAGGVDASGILVGAADRLAPVDGLVDTTVGGELDGVGGDLGLGDGKRVAAAESAAPRCTSSLDDLGELFAAPALARHPKPGFACLAMP